MRKDNISAKLIEFEIERIKAISMEPKEQDFMI